MQPEYKQAAQTTPETRDAVGAGKAGRVRQVEEGAGGEKVKFMFTAVEQVPVVRACLVLRHRASHLAGCMEFALYESRDH